jgi:GNAT superfamily N-acetyltransferase
MVSDVGSRAVTRLGVARREVRPGAPSDIDAVLEIVAGLPEYFSADVPDQVWRDASEHAIWIVAEHERVVGFAIVARRSVRAAEILWAAVAADRRRERLGTLLVDGLLADLYEDGVGLVEVKTLDPAAGHVPYAATHAFWVSRGFVQLDTLDPLPGWRPGNPCAVLVAALRTSVA